MSLCVYKSRNMVAFIAVMLVLMIAADIGIYYLLTYHKELIVRPARLTFLFNISLGAAVVLFLRLLYEFYSRNSPAIIFGESLIEINRILNCKSLNWEDINSVSITNGKIFDQINFKIKKNELNSADCISVKELSVNSDVVKMLKRKNVDILNIER